MKKLCFAIALLCAVGAASAQTGAAPAPATQPFVLDNTEVRDVRAPALKRDYQLYVALPDSYRDHRETARRYPVVFVTDANYAFPIVRGIASRLTKHAGMEETIVVGLSYAKGDTGVYSRRRDYTPPCRASTTGARTCRAVLSPSAKPPLTHASWLRTCCPWSQSTTVPT